MSFAEQLRSFYISEQASANTTYDTNIIFAGVYSAVLRECKRQAIGNVALPPVPNVVTDRGLWSPTTTYFPGDGISQNNAQYVCIVGNTNQPPPNVLFWAVIPPTNIIWKGPWNNLLDYVYGDGVSEAGLSYVCIQSHLGNPGQMPPNADYWAVYTPPARSFTLGTAATVAAVASVTSLPRPNQGGGIITWRGAWNSFTEYVLNDAVSYFGTSYVCAIPADGSIPPSPPNANWYVPIPSNPIYPLVPQTGTYVATDADLVLIRDRLIKNLTSADIGLTAVPSGAFNVTISW